MEDYVELGQIRALRKGNARRQAGKSVQMQLNLSVGYQLEEGVLLKAVDASGRTSAAGVLASQCGVGQEASELAGLRDYEMPQIP